MKLETDFRDSLTSSLNREASFRESVDSSLAKVEASLTANIEQLEKSIVDCLLRRDDMWKKQLDRLRPTSTPIEQRNKAGPTEVSPKVPLAPFSPPGASPYFSKPPVHLEFPTFGTACKSSDVLNFIEQCENFLDLRPLSNHELLGTLSTVLKGPALKAKFMIGSHLKTPLCLLSSLLTI